MQVKEYEDKIQNLEKDVASHKDEISSLKNTISNFTGFENEVKEMREKMESISGVYEDLHEKVHTNDKTM